MSSTSLADAMTAAAARAGECRERLAQLRAGGPYDDTDVARARERLESARHRANGALVRAARQTLSETAGTDSDLRETTIAAITATVVRDAAWVGPVDASTFGDRLERLDCSVADVWLGYCAFGGTCSTFEVDAALHGALQLPWGEQLRVDQALWELENADL